MTVNIDNYAEGAVRLDGLDSAIIGITEEFGGNRRLLYGKTEILKILMSRDGMTHSEAEEFYDYNILGLYAGEQNPIFLDLSITPFNSKYGWDFKID
jgi:hypothetical protein